jgi:hypothetical protein
MIEQVPSKEQTRPKWYMKAKERMALMKRFAVGTDVHLLEMACKDYDDQQTTIERLQRELAETKEASRKVVVAAAQQAIRVRETASGPPPGARPARPLEINGAQVAALVDFLDLNGTPEARETPLSLCYYDEERKDKHEGDTMPPGLYAWFTEYPEEGQLWLDPNPKATAAKA